MDLRRLIGIVKSPKTTAYLKLCIAVVGLVSAIDDIRQLAKGEDPS